MLLDGVGSSGSVGSPASAHASKPPTMSVARVKPSRCRVAAAMLDEYPSWRITITGPS